MSMGEARRSVNDADLHKYSMFSQKLKQEKNAINGNSHGGFKFPVKNSLITQDVEEEDDLYA